MMSEGCSKRRRGKQSHLNSPRWKRRCLSCHLSSRGRALKDSRRQPRERSTSTQYRSFNYSSLKGHSRREVSIRTTRGVTLGAIFSKGWLAKKMMLMTRNIRRPSIVRREASPILDFELSKCSLHMTGRLHSPCFKLRSYATLTRQIGVLGVRISFPCIRLRR